MLETGAGGNFPRAGETSELIGQLYEIDRSCPTGPPSDELRRKLRDERARPVVAAFEAFVRSTPAIPQNGLAKAFEYALGCWPGLVRFLEDRRIPLDNNATKRALRGVVVGASATPLLHTSTRTGATWSGTTEPATWCRSQTETTKTGSRPSREVAHERAGA